MHSRSALVCLLLIVLLLIVAPVVAIWTMFAPEHPKHIQAQELVYVPPRAYVCHRATGPIHIDGKLDDAAWQAAPWSEPFVDIEGDRKPAPRFRTRVKMLWDDQCLYIGAELEEPHVWATLRQHDSVIFQDNDFEVFLNPDGDSHMYAELELNALNTTWDLLLPKPYKDGGRPVNAWEILGLRTAVHVDGTLNNSTDSDHGWSVEIAWPWEGLKELTGVPVPPRDGDQWRINFSRVEWDMEIVDRKYHKIEKRPEHDPEHNWVWSPQGVINMHRPETWGYLQFSAAPVGTAKLRPDPAGPAKALLHEVYYKQHAFREKHGSWAESLDDLGLGGLSHPDVIGAPRMQTTEHLFEVSVEAREPRRRWHIRSDALIWGD